MVEPDPPKLYPRGFILAKNAPPFLWEIPHYREHVVGEYRLFVDEVTEVETAVRENSWVVVAGKAVALSTGTLDPGKSLAGQLIEYIELPEGLAAVETALYDLAGRYAVILGVGGSVYAYNDAAATRSIFFDATEERLASHFDMLRKFRADELDSPAFSAEVKNEHQWHLTADSRIGAVTANMRLDLKHGRLDRYHLKSPNPAKALSHDERLECISKLWNEQVEYLLGLDLPLALSLSGGMDSRLMLATVRDVKDRFTSMTYTTAAAMEGRQSETKWGQVMAKDFHIVEGMRELRPEDHHYIPRKPEPWVSEHREILDRNATNNHGRWILPGYLRIFADRRSVHYRGNLLEIGRMHYGVREKMPAGRDRVLSIIKFASQRYSEAERENVESVARLAMDTLDYDGIDEGYDLSDVFYWEIRHSRWYGQLLNETDVAFDSISPFNARRIIDMFLAYSKRDRARALVQRELTYRSNPLLMFFGVNEITDLYREFVSDGTATDA